MSKIWTLILLLTALANAVTGIWSALHDRYDKGAYFVAMAIFLWLLVQRREEE